MKPFAELTAIGKRRRLTELAREAIARFPIDVSALRFLAEHTNLVFRVDAADGARYALRVCAPGQHSISDYTLELAWLDALARETRFNLAHPIAARDGAFLIRETHPDVDGERICMLFTWVPGKAAGYYSVDQKLAPMLGEAMATLHVHARGFALPAGAQPLRWNRAFYFEHEPTVVYDASHAHLFTPEDIANIRAAQKRVDAAIAELWARGPGPHLIHTDLHGGNVHLHDGALWLFDFEDLSLGAPGQDIASALYPARYHSPDYAQIVTAFRLGYERVAAWPLLSELELETMIVARVLMFVNYCANGYDGDPDMRRSLPNLLKRVAAFVENQPR
jgi:Ser/Thr protein kinase RdoA (MazF antagonist)